MKHEAKSCPRCGNEFECKLGNVLECQCSGVTLSDAALDLIHEQYDDCLCRGCLTALQEAMQQGESREVRSV